MANPANSHRPLLAIVGRPNVGKSALFNRICQKRIAIVDEEEGVTRDRLYAEAEFFGFAFRVIDTGGIDPTSEDAFQEHIRMQAEIAIAEADAIVMVVDGRIGATTLDMRLANLLLKSNKPLCIAVNKVDDPAQLHFLNEFYCLGISKMIPVSALQGFQIAELIEAAWKGVKVSENEEASPSSGTKISIIGRPNVGKSTLVNALLNEQRCIVSPLPGTTRDSVDIPFSYEGKNYVIIDTAGVRRKKSEKNVIEKFAAIRTEESIERADICLLMLDVQEGVTSQEKRIAKDIELAGKGCIIVLNKWDLVSGFRMEHCLKALHEESPFLAHCPTVIISAKTGRNLDKLIPHVEMVSGALETRITTHQLNKFLERTMQLNHPPMLQGKRLRVYYMTQVSTRPPTFVLFVNKPELMTETYKRYLINQFREHYPFPGIPLIFELRGKEEKKRAPMPAAEPSPEESSVTQCSE